MNAGLLLEHLAQRGQCQAEGRCIDHAEPPHHALLVESSKLIEQYQPILPSKAK